MSFTTRQLGANRVNKMPGAPVSCEVKNYTLEEFDGIIKGTDDNHIPRKIKCTNTGILKVDIVNQQDDGAILNVDNTTLDPAIKDIDDVVNNGQDKFLVVGGKKGTKYDSLHIENDGSLKVTVCNPPGNNVTSEVDNALVTVDNNGEQLTEPTKFLAMGGRVYEKNIENEEVETNNFKELKVNKDGEITVNIKDAGVSLDGDISLDNDVNNPLHVTNNILNKALHEYGLGVDDTEFNDRLLAVAAVRNNTYDSLNLNNDGNLKVVDEELGKTIKPTGNGNNDNFLVMGGRKWDDNTAETNDFRELKVNEDGVLSVNFDSTSSLDVNIKNGSLPITSDSLDNIANAIVKKGDLETPNANVSHMNICATTKNNDGNETFKPVQCDNEGTLFVTTKTGKTVKVENDKLSECISTDDENIPNSNYVRVKNVDGGTGIVMRAVDVVGGGGASLHTIQGDVTNLQQATTVKTAPRLITIDLGPDVMYITNGSTPNMQNLSGQAGWPESVSNGLSYDTVNIPIRIISAGNNRPRINKIRISFRIVQATNNEFVADDNSEKLFIYGGQESVTAGSIVNSNNLQIFPIEYVTFEDLMKTKITNTTTTTEYHYFHSFVIDMPMGPEIGFFSTKALNKVYVSVAIVKF